jgi:hypothetical protein
MVSSGEPVLREDGTVEVVPLQVFRLHNGATVIRLGRTTIWFNEQGKLDGTEHLTVGLSAEQKQALVDALEASRGNRGRAPTEPYFQPGEKGHAAEVAGWPKAGAFVPPADEGKVYGIAGEDRRPRRN